MSFRRYENYQDVGVEWLGAVPSHWRVDRLKASVRSCRNGVWGDEADGGEDDLICVRVADFDRSGMTVKLDRPTWRKIAPKDRQGRLLRRGNLLLEKSGGGEKQPVGAVVIYDHGVDAVCSNFVARLELEEGLHPKFWLYAHAAAYAVRLTERSINQTSGIQNLDQHRYFEEPAPFPPLAEQVAIAQFLDRETAKIDALVEEQRRLIELLKEKRQAVICHAVTKGLDALAPMRETDVELLGTIPAHWQVVPARALVRLVRELVGDLHDDFELLSLTLRGIIVRDRHSGEGKFPAEFNSYQAVRPNDLIFCLFDMDETPRTVGLSGSAGMVTGAYDVFRAHTEELAHFVYWVYLSRDFRKQLRPYYTGLRKVIRKETFGSIPVALPPEGERRKIVEYLTAATERFEALSAEAESAIRLLQERRAALISAAVTGKIDVREPAAASAELEPA